MNKRNEASVCAPSNSDSGVRRFKQSSLILYWRGAFLPALGINWVRAMLQTDLAATILSYCIKADLTVTELTRKVSGNHDKNNGSYQRTRGTESTDTRNFKKTQRRPTQTVPADNATWQAVPK